MARKIRKLVIDSVDAVDRGAGEGCAVVLMKRDAAVTFAKDGNRWQLPAEGDLTEKLVQAAPALGVAVDVKKRSWDVLDARGKVLSTHASRKDAKRARNRANSAARGESAIGATWSEENDSLAKAKAEIKANKRLAKALAAASLEDPNMFTDVQKAEAVSVVQKFNARVEEVARRDFIGYGEAMNKIAGASFLVSPEDASLWNEYRQAAEIMKAAHPTPVSVAPAPMVSNAYMQLEKRAEKLRKNNPRLSQASAFSAAYQDPANRDLAEADKQFHFNKAAFGAQPVDPKSELVRALVASLG